MNTNNLKVVKLGKQFVMTLAVTTLVTTVLSPTLHLKYNLNTEVSADRTFSFSKKTNNAYKSALKIMDKYHESTNSYSNLINNADSYDSAASSYGSELSSASSKYNQYSNEVTGNKSKYDSLLPLISSAYSSYKSARSAEYIGDADDRSAAFSASSSLYVTFRSLSSLAQHYDGVAATYYEDNDGNKETLSMAAEGKNNAERSRDSALKAAQEQKSIASRTSSALPLAKSKAFSYAKSDISKYSRSSSKSPNKTKHLKEEFQIMKSNLNRLD